MKLFILVLFLPAVYNHTYLIIYDFQKIVSHIVVLNLRLLLWISDYCFPSNLPVIGIVSSFSLRSQVLPKTICNNLSSLFLAFPSQLSKNASMCGVSSSVAGSHWLVGNHVLLPAIFSKRLSCCGRQQAEGCIISVNLQASTGLA